MCNLAFCLKTRNQRARKQFGIHNSQELTNLNVLRGQRSLGISFNMRVKCGVVWRQIMNNSTRATSDINNSFMQNILEMLENYYYSKTQSSIIVYKVLPTYYNF